MCYKSKVLYNNVYMYVFYIPILYFLIFTSIITTIYFDYSYNYIYYYVKYV